MPLQSIGQNYGENDVCLTCYRTILSPGCRPGLGLTSWCRCQKVQRSAQEHKAQQASFAEKRHICGNCGSDHIIEKAAK